MDLENVIKRLKQTIQVAVGQDQISMETYDVQLYGMFQNGLW